MRLFAFLFLSLFLALPAPAEDGRGPVSLAIGLPKAPPALPVLRMIESGVLRGKADIKISVWTAPEQLIAMAQDGNHQMFALPLTVAAKLHNRGVGIRLTNVNTWDVACLVTSDPALAGWNGLEGKKLFVPLRSSTPDALTRYFLARAGMKAGKNVEFVYSSFVEIGQLLMAGKIDYAVLHEPQVTAALAANPKLRVAIRFEDEWKKIPGTGGRIPNAAMGGTAAFIDTHPDLIRAFEREYEIALAWVLEHPAEAAALAEKRLGLKAAMLAPAIPRLGLHYKSAADAEGDVEALYKLLFDFSPDMIGKKIPDATLFWR